jgi:hypothetical protein
MMVRSLKRLNPFVLFGMMLALIIGCQASPDVSPMDDGAVSQGSPTLTLNGTGGIVSHAVL